MKPPQRGVVILSAFATAVILGSMHHGAVSPWVVTALVIFYIVMWRASRPSV